MTSDSFSGLSADTNIYNALALEKHLPCLPFSSLYPNTMYDDMGVKDSQLHDSSPAPPPKQLKHQKSAKHLISHFESMSHDSPLGLSPTPKVKSPASKKSHHMEPPTDEATPKNKRSPLRKSFQSLFTALRKGRVTHPDPNTGSTQKPDKEKPLIYEPTISENPTMAGASADSSAGLNTMQHPYDSQTIKPARSDELLYLARLSISNPALHSVWTHAKVSLEGPNLVVTQSSSQGHPCINTIPLLHCTDVRSVCQDDIEGNEWALLPMDVVDSRESRLFELLFEGRPREKFVAPTVPDRARWISTIWFVLIIYSCSDVLSNQNIGALF
jgi:hypothetical protein